MKLVVGTFRCEGMPPAKESPGIPSLRAFLPYSHFPEKECPELWAFLRSTYSFFGGIPSPQSKRKVFPTSLPLPALCDNHDE